MKQSFYEFKSPFTKEELNYLIEKYSKDLPPLQVVGDSKDVFRIGQGCWISQPDPVVDRFKNIISGITGLPVENQESPNFIKYEVGGHYKHHHDYFDPKASYYPEHHKRGGQRVFTSIFYLNDDFEGGETEFPKIPMVVKPEAGKIFTWRNMTTDGKLYEDSYHAGLPVTNGIKYIIVVWFRENKFV